MQSEKVLRGWFLGVIVVVIVMALGASFVIDRAEKSRAAIDVIKPVPPFEFTGHRGEPFSLENMKGTISIVDFIFTTCPDICPAMSAKMKSLYELYGDSEKVQFVSFSVDPDNDTIPKLKEYADKLGVYNDRWTFVRGPIEEIAELSEKGFYLPARDLPMGHSSRFVLVDRDGMIRGYYESLETAKINLLKEHIVELARQK